jgi:hydrogenase/urease accessory protein HupE
MLYVAGASTLRRETVKKPVLIVAAIAIPGSASAHPEHLADLSPGLMHLLTDPFHLSLMVVVTGLAFGLRWLMRRAAR